MEVLGHAVFKVGREGGRMGVMSCIGIHDVPSGRIMYVLSVSSSRISSSSTNVPSSSSTNCTVLSLTPSFLDAVNHNSIIN